MEASSCLRYRVCGFGSPRIWLCILLVLVLQNCSLALSASPYLVGMGSYDITGPAADVNMMGYANAEQIASGIHFRLKSRAFIVAEPNGKRVVFVNLDACMASQLVTIKVVERLKARYGGLYNESNVAISGIHTHAGPGGYLQYVVYIVTSLGFVRQSFDVIVDGIEQSIVEAHNNLRPGKIFVNKGDLLDAGLNRSPSAYLNNPADERSKYQYNVDKEMTLVKFVDDQLGPVGSFNWFATHGTSMSRTNSFISGDNKGAAARFMEDWAEQNDIPKQAVHANSDDLGSLHKTSGLPRRVSTIIPEPNEITDDLIQLASSYEASGGRRLAGSSITRRIRSTQENKAKFVSAFCQSNCGDVSPNVLGTFCIDTHLPCDFNHSTCNGKNELCYGRGPGYPDEFESTRIIGNRQFLKAVDLFNSASEEIQGKLDYRHTYLDFSQLEVSVSTSTGDQQVVKTCPAAMGFAFAAGTTDGPGAFDFKQGDVKGNPFWKLVRNLLKPPGKEQVECQAPKPILLDTGEMKEPYDWAVLVLLGHDHDQCTFVHSTSFWPVMEHTLGTISWQQGNLYPSFMLLSAGPKLSQNSTDLNHEVLTYLCYLPKQTHIYIWYICQFVGTILLLIFWPTNGLSSLPYVNTFVSFTRSVGAELFSRTKQKDDEEDGEYDMVWDAKGSMHLVEKAVSRAPIANSESRTTGRGNVVARPIARKHQLDHGSSVFVEMSSEMTSEDGGKLPRPSKSKIRKVLQRLFRVIQSIVVIATVNVPLYMMLLFKDCIDH